MNEKTNLREKMRKTLKSNLLIEAKDLTFKYDDQKNPTIENISFSIFEKEFVSIIGPNGGGKSTLVKLILGLLKPTSGQISILGKDPENSRLNIGYVPQHINFDPLYPISAFDVVMMGRLNKNFFKRFDKNDLELVNEAIKLVGMQGFEKKLLSNLSGGQKQRILIARALSVDSSILILDEPTAFLDKEAQVFMYELLRKINQTKTIILVSHDTSFVPSISSSVLCLNRNRFEYSNDFDKNLNKLSFYNCEVEKIKDQI